MNKQEAIEKIKNIETFPVKGMIADQIVDVVIKNQVLDIVSKIHEPQKPVIPKFVAEWIKKYKDKGYRLSHALEKVFDDVELSLYIKQQLGDYTETIAKAWLAYPNITVEKEKLYTVEIGGVGSSKLFKNTRTNEYIFHSGKELDWFHNVKELELYTDKLTEQEIKKADERLWEFAKPVEDK